FFFFSSRRRHTRFSRDWSSDVCSSDLSPYTFGSNRMTSGTAKRVEFMQCVPSGCAVGIDRNHSLAVVERAIPLERRLSILGAKRSLPDRRLSSLGDVPAWR